MKSSSECATWLLTILFLFDIFVIVDMISIDGTSIPEDLDVVVGDNAEFSCNIIGSTDNIELQWQVDWENSEDIMYISATEENTHNFDSRGTYQIEYNIQQETHHLKLVINGITRNDAGRFACVYRYLISGSTPNLFHRAVSLTVMYPPDDQYPRCSANVAPIDNPSIQGSVSVHLTCFSEGGFPLPTFQWFVEGDDTPRFEDREASITLLPSDAGRRFLCRIFSDAISGYRECDVTPIQDEVHTSSEPATQANIYPPGPPSCNNEVEMTSDPNVFQVLLSCVSVGGSPPPSLTWSYDVGTPIQGQTGGQANVFMSRDYQGRAFRCTVTSPALNEPLSCFTTPNLPALPTTVPPPPTTTTWIPLVTPNSFSCTHNILSYNILPDDIRVSVQLTCTSEGGIPRADLTWYNANNEIISDQGINQVQDISVNSPKMFKCVATSPAITSELACTVMVTRSDVPTSPPKTEAPLRAPRYPPVCYHQLTTQISRDTDASILLTCLLNDGNPLPSLLFYDQDNQPVGNSGIQAIYVNVNIAPTLSHTFTCRATSTAITMDSICTVNVQRYLDPTTLQPTTVPAFVPTTFAYVPPHDGYPRCYDSLLYILSGQAFVFLECVSEGGNPPAKLSWHSSTGLLNDMPTVQVGVVLGMEATYSCQAQSPAIIGYRSCTVTLSFPLETTPKTTTPRATTPKATIPKATTPKATTPHVRTTQSSPARTNPKPVTIPKPIRTTHEETTPTATLSTKSLSTMQSGDENTQTTKFRTDQEDYTAKRETPSGGGTPDGLIAIVSISVGVLILIIIIVLIVGCILRGVVRKSNNPYYGGHRFRNVSTSSSIVDPLSPFHTSNHPVVNPVFQNGIDERPLQNHTYHTTVEDMNDRRASVRPEEPFDYRSRNSMVDELQGAMEYRRNSIIKDNHHPYEYPSDDNPYEYAVNDHIYSVSS